MQKNTNGTIRLDSVHGYRVDGDNVELEAQLLLGEGASLNNWKLQLWANDILPNGIPAGVKVAEVNLEQARVNDGVARLASRVDAVLPPTGRYYDMALVLARAEDEGAEDVAKYSQRQWFAGPALHGAVGYSVCDGQVRIDVEQVNNPRSADNVSGTLALELWAVSEPYVGGAVRGHQMAGAVLGTLSGQASWSQTSATVAFNEPPAGLWQVVLMLREWTAAGYVTRDYRSFDAWYRVTNSAASQDLEASATPRADTAVDALAVVAAAVQPTEPATPKAPPTSVVDPQWDTRVSVQTASVDELTRVKGISKKVAEEIVRKRPFQSLNDLTKVKGIGDKTLRAIRNAIRI